MQAIEAVVGKPKSLAMTVKDYATAKGIEFSEIKAKLAALVPSK